METLLFPAGEITVQGKVKERWRELCELAATEQDPTKLSALVAEIDRLLEEKQSRLSQSPGDAGEKPSSR